MLELKGDGDLQAYDPGHSLYARAGMHVRGALPRMQQVSGQGMPPAVKSNCVTDPDAP